jgi:alpha-ketoglutarate-dependent taurine dioxygenase
MRAQSTFQVEPLDATFGAVVTDIELADLDETTFDSLSSAWLEYALLIFPGQHLTTKEQVAFARRFGDTGTYTAPNGSGI